ncbi:hypothetical protein EVAR_54523_1 [Eumeta japonica]|uniref:Uncharacterized protein n=1 Tax=Eumeta variegata TaxID=151549 RepID=A0A4C1YK47_EUMVA|nr:hypothetical protein EVAR_54523_1 [Eumeta japonica]
MTRVRLQYSLRAAVVNSASNFGGFHVCRPRPPAPAGAEDCTSQSLDLEGIVGASEWSYRHLSHICLAELFNVENATAGFDPPFVKFAFDRFERS